MAILIGLPKHKTQICWTRLGVCVHSGMRFFGVGHVLLGL